MTLVGITELGLGPLDDCRSLVEAVLLLGPHDGIVVHHPNVAVHPDVLAALRRTADAPLAASVSPIALNGTEYVTVVAAPHLLDAPTIANPSCDLVLLLPDALASLDFQFQADASWTDQLSAWATTARNHGWRHVGAPGLIGPSVVALESDSLAHELDGPANELLSTHRLWARTRRYSLRVVIDGACIEPGAEATGTYQVVIELSLELARSRPTADVALAVPSGNAGAVVKRLVMIPNLRLVPRDAVEHFDVVYRPYQYIYPDQIAWTFAAGARTVLGQLDMIAFSNPSYHPQPQTFFAARNMQRATMRRADLVTTISKFAASTILAECPDLEARRVVVIPCGTDHVSPVAPKRPDGLGPSVNQFLACLSATFWHKNRPHAIRTFAELRRRGYPGHLVIAGPQPYFGRSTDVEDVLLAAMPAPDRDAVHRIGSVDEAGKWWLLASADAVLYPSINEGFGLVPFEAATVGTPTLAGTTASLPEVYGGTALLAPDWSPSSWADIVEQWIGEPRAAQDQVDALRVRATELTWRRAAEQTWAAFDTVLSLPHRQPTAFEGDRWASMESHRLGLTGPATGVRYGRRIGAYAARRIRKTT